VVEGLLQNSNLGDEFGLVVQRLGHSFQISRCCLARFDFTFHYISGVKKGKTAKIV